MRRSDDATEKCLMLPVRAIVRVGGATDFSHDVVRARIGAGSPAGLPSANRYRLYAILTLLDGCAAAGVAWECDASACVVERSWRAWVA